MVYHFSKGKGFTGSHNSKNKHKNRHSSWSAWEVWWALVWTVWRIWLAPSQEFLILGRQEVVYSPGWQTLTIIEKVEVNLKQEDGRSPGRGSRHKQEWQALFFEMGCSLQPWLPISNGLKLDCWVWRSLVVRWNRTRSYRTAARRRQCNIFYWSR